MRRTYSAVLLLSIAVWGGIAVRGQSVSPVIQEYKGKADGKFAVINNTLEPMTVVIEPKSFSIGPDGRGTFRALDPGIKVELSAMTVKLQPEQTYWVFYKASAEKTPAWFTIYSSFSTPRRGESISVQIQLPHTVYLYQNGSLQKGNIVMGDATYSVATHKLLCTVQNAGGALGRVHEVLTSGPHGASVSLAGFPLLPGMTRNVEVDWKADEPPTSISFMFEHFTLKPQIVVQSDVAATNLAAKDSPAAVR
jgi:hypothetical protein